MIDLEKVQLEIGCIVWGVIIGLAIGLHVGTSIEHRRSEKEIQAVWAAFQWHLDKEKEIK